MKVVLTPELEALVDGLVRSGRYADSSDVMREALRRLVRADELHAVRLAQLRAELEVGLADLREGRVARLETSDDIRALFETL